MLSISNIPITKKALTALVEEQVEAVKNPLQLYIQGKILKDLGDKLQGAVKGQVNLNEELPSEFTHMQVSERHGYDVLDYEADEEYCRLKAKLDARKKLLDAAVKASRDFRSAIVDDNGEVVPVVSVKSTTSNSIVICY
jgi:hypothetical protein